MIFVFLFFALIEAQNTLLIRDPIGVTLKPIIKNPGIIALACSAVTDCGVCAKRTDCSYCVNTSACNDFAVACDGVTLTTTTTATPAPTVATVATPATVPRTLVAPDTFAVVKTVPKASLFIDPNPKSLALIDRLLVPPPAPTICGGGDSSCCPATTTTTTTKPAVVIDTKGQGTLSGVDNTVNLPPLTKDVTAKVDADATKNVETAASATGSSASSASNTAGSTNKSNSNGSDGKGNGVSGDNNNQLTEAIDNGVAKQGLSNDMLGIIIGCVIGGVLCLVGIVMLVVALRRSNNNNGGNNDAPNYNNAPIVLPASAVYGNVGGLRSSGTDSSMGEYKAFDSSKGFV